MHLSDQTGAQKFIRDLILSSNIGFSVIFPTGHPQKGLADVKEKVQYVNPIATHINTQGDSDVISMLAGFRRHLVGSDKCFVFHCDIAEIRFVGKRSYRHFHKPTD